MKASEKIMMKTDNLKTYGSMIGKAGYGMKLAAILGYKAGYNMAKHPGIEKIKKQLTGHPKAGVFALIGVGISILGLAGYLMKQRA